MGVNPDELLAVLADEQRRILLRELDDGPRTVEELAAALAAADESRGEDEAVLAVHHVHVPKLADVGLVDVDGNVVAPNIDTGDTETGPSEESTSRRHA